ncbi:MAG: HypC/HybG/HupF family hydrogenase formation chaperone [Candidatus Binatia bacterium]
MCLAIPMQLVERSEWDGTAELRGVQRQVSLMLCPEAQVGEYVLVHAGYAITTVDADEARKTLEILDAIVQEDISQ